MKKFLLVLLLIVSIHSFSQTETGNLETYLQEKINHIPGETGDNYTVPTDTQLTTWSNCVNAILSNDIVSARTFAEMLNYEIVTYRDTEVYVNRTVYILEEKANQTNYWGTYVFDNNSIRFPMVLQAPHSIFDFNTGKQAIYCFVRLEAKFLFLNGTQRCNNNLASTCSGTTSVCSGSSDAFKVSDLAHNTNSVWQKTTEIIYNTISESLFIQLHGFSKENSDPYVIISNGTNQNPAGKDYAAEIKNYLLSEDNNLTFKVAHLDDWTRLTGFTNSQGRFINNSTDACKTAASNASGRFIHIEQEKSKLREDETGWNKMYGALAPIAGPGLNVQSYSPKIIMKSSNPFSNEIKFSALNIDAFYLYDVLGKEIYHFKNEKLATNFEINTTNLKKGIYLLKVKNYLGIAFKKLIHE